MRYAVETLIGPKLPKDMRSTESRACETNRVESAESNSSQEPRIHKKRKVD